jgi:hypothetical protein
MTKDDIEQDDQQFFELWLAHKSVVSPSFVTGSHTYWAWQGYLIGVKQEREACAKVCEELCEYHKELWKHRFKKTEEAKWEVLTHCAELIRSGGKNDT